MSNRVELLHAKSDAQQRMENLAPIVMREVLAELSAINRSKKKRRVAGIVVAALLVLALWLVGAAAQNAGDPDLLSMSAVRSGFWIIVVLVLWFVFDIFARPLEMYEWMPEAQELGITDRENVVKRAIARPESAAVVRGWVQKDRVFCRQEEWAVGAFLYAADELDRYDATTNLATAT